MNTSTKFSNISISEKAKNRGLKHIAFLLLKRNYLISTECVTSLVSMDIMEKIEVIKLYIRNIKRSQSFSYNVHGFLGNSKRKPLRNIASNL